MGWVINATLRPLYPRERPGRRLGGPLGRTGRVLKNLSPTGIRSPDRPARSESNNNNNYYFYFVFFDQMVCRNQMLVLLLFDWPCLTVGATYTWIGQVHMLAVRKARIPVSGIIHWYFHPSGRKGFTRLKMTLNFETPQALLCAEHNAALMGFSLCRIHLSTFHAAQHVMCES